MNVTTIDNCIVFVPDVVVKNSPVLEMLQRNRQHNVESLFLCVDSKTLSFVIEYTNLFTKLKLPKWKPFPIPEKATLQDFITAQEFDFIMSKTNDELLEIIGFCDYIDFAPLRNLVALRVAFEMHSKLKAS